MNEERAREILPINDDNSIGPDYGHYMSWEPGNKDITLDSDFTLEELEALVWWIRNKNGVEAAPNDLLTKVRCIAWRDEPRARLIQEIRLLLPLP